MTTTSGRPLLVADPWLPWPRPFAYTYLNERLRQVNEPEIHSESTGDQIQDDVGFALMGAAEFTQQDQQALDDLGQVERRLLLEFFMYRLREPAHE
jgi:hypothetical protein